MGSDLNTGTLNKVKDILPHQIGDNRRWSDAFVNDLVTFVAGVAAERIGYAHADIEIVLIGNQHEYSLPTSIISVTRVEFNKDSTDSIELIPSTFRDFDSVSGSWRTNRGSKPEMYTLLDTPGTPNSTIFIYPPQASDTMDTLTIRGLFIVEGDVMDDLQDKFIVPYTISMLYAGDDVEKASWYMSMADRGAYELMAQYKDESPAGF